MTRRARVRSLLMVMVLGFAGCGRDAHLAEFQTWIARDLEARGPFRIVALRIEPPEAGDRVSFDFHGELELTENLYRRLNLLDEGKLEELRMEAKEAGLSLEEINAIAAPLATTKEITFCEPLASNGKIFEFSGRARALPGGWGDFEILSLEGSDILQGERHQEGWVDGSGAEGKKRLFETKTKILDVLKNFESSIVQKNLETDSKDLKRQSFLATCRPGTKLKGLWKIDGSQGQLGIEFTKQDAGDGGVFLEGFLFDPAVPQYQKPFKGRIVDSEDDQEPFELQLVVRPEEGGVPVHDEILNVRSKAQQAGLINKTLGLLLVQSDYALTLRPARGGALVGRIQQSSELNRPQVFDADPAVEFRAQFQGLQRLETITSSDNSGVTTIHSSFSTKGTGLLPPSKMLPETQKPVAPPLSGFQKILIQAAVQAEPMAREFSEAISSGNSVEANKIFQQMMRKYPDAPQTLALRISQAHSLGNTQQAQQLYQKLKSYPLPPGTKEQVDEIGEMIMRKK